MVGDGQCVENVWASTCIFMVMAAAVRGGGRGGGGGGGGNGGSGGDGHGGGGAVATLTFRLFAAVGGNMVDQMLCKPLPLKHVGVMASGG